MKNKRKISLALIILFTLALFSSSIANAQPQIIHEASTKQNVAAGVTLENIVRFTTDGWFNINILRIDLSNKYISVDAISNPESIRKLTPVKALAESRGAVAAVNASFFNPTGDGYGYPDGPIVESGEIVSAYSEYNKYNDIMASFSIDKLGQLLYSYWKVNMELRGAEGKTLPVTQYNKPSRLEYTDFTVIDRKWNSMSIGASETYPDIVEMVVRNNVVVEIHEGRPAVEIPEDGYIVVTREAGGGKLLKQYFKPGDSIEWIVTTAPDWNDLNMSVTGASILVKDGKIPDKFSFNIASISKKQPRTAIGSTKDGNMLFLVTVDGRQNSSIGMSQLEIAQFMLGLGAYNALNLDGGGSTTMAVRTTGTNELKVVNSPSDNTPRIVSNAIGVFSTAPAAPLAGLIIDTEDTNIFVNTSRAFSVRGYDKYFNPVQINPEDVEWSVSGIKGTFKDNVFYPQSVGEGKITAAIGKVTGTINISSLSQPVQLFLSRKSLKLPLGQTFNFSVSGINKNGYGAKINPEDLNWVVKGMEGNIGKIDKGSFTAVSGGTGYIDAWIGDTHAYCAVSVATEIVKATDKFETINGSFLSYPDIVQGSYKLSSSRKYSGNYSGRLMYKFSDSEETEAAYLVFSNGGIPLDASTSKIGLWVYNTHSHSNWLRAEIVDKSGKKNLVSFSQAMDWTGWKYVEASLNGISSPSLLTRIYLAKVHPVADSGSIYFDDLKIISSTYPEIDISKIPQDTVPKDEANKSTTYEESGDSFRFAVFGQSRLPKNPLERILLARLCDKINMYIDAAAFVGNHTGGMAKTVEKPSASTDIGYKSFDIKNSRFIQLDTSKQGLRLSSQDQWHWLLNQLESFKGNNIFIFLADSPDSFSDKLEAGLFKETLTQYTQKTGRKVWVFYKGSQNASYMERGIKYITCAGFDVSGLTPDNTDIAKYVLVTVKGGTVTFEFKPII